MKGALLTVDRGDGNLFTVRENRLTAFMRRYPKGFVVGSAAHKPPVAVEPTTDATPSLEDMTVVQLKALAAEKDVELPSGANKAGIIEALNAAEVTP